jgi:hypothetical protein
METPPRIELKRGRPSTAEVEQRKAFADMQAARLIEMVKTGLSMRKAAEIVGIPESTARVWVDAYMPDAFDLARIELMDDVEAVAHCARRVMNKKHVHVSAGVVVMAPLRDANGEIVFQQARDRAGNLLYDRENRPVMSDKPVLSDEPLEDDAPKMAAGALIMKTIRERATVMGLDKPNKVAPAAPADPAAAVPSDSKAAYVKELLASLQRNKDEVVDVTATVVSNG